MEKEKDTFVLYRPRTPPPGWKCPKQFKLGLGSPWESSDSEEDCEREIDELLLMASQQYEEQSEQEGESAHEGNTASGASRYGCPVSTVQVEAMRKTGVAVKTQEQNNWAASVWHDWATYRRNMVSVEVEEEEHDLKEEFTEMSVAAMNFWLCKFVIEVRRKDAKPYAPDTLYQACCGLLRLLKEAGRAEVNMFTDPRFHQFRGTLDARMKELRSTGNYQVKRAEVISEEDENLLWDKKLLGDGNPEQLINTMVFYIGLFL